MSFNYHLGNLIFRKFRSFWKYTVLFHNWWIAASARYLRGRLGHVQLLRFRDGRRLTFRPASDYVALGEVFIAQEYIPCLTVNNVRLVWDIGGNIGCFTIWASKHFKEAEFHSFEPCQESFQILQSNQQNNPHINWQVHPFGMSNQDGFVAGHVPEEKYGETSRFATSGRAVELNLKGIEGYWQEQGRPTIGMLKIDCEGNEYDIFAGASSELLNSIHFMIIEVHPIPEKDPATLKTILKDSGFYIHWRSETQGIVWAWR